MSLGPGDGPALAQVRTKARVSLVPAVVEFARLVLETFPQLARDSARLYRLQLAVSEACTNVAKHAYHEGLGEMELCIYEVRGGIRLEISDWGKSFDPYAQPAPDLDNPKGNGLGLFIIRQCADRVDYLRGQGRNTLSLGVDLEK